MIAGWVLTPSAKEAAERMGAGEREIVTTFEQPDWVYESQVFAGAKVALGGRLAVAHDETSKIVLHVSWRDSAWNSAKNA